MKTKYKIGDAFDTKEMIIIVTDAYTDLNPPMYGMSQLTIAGRVSRASYGRGWYGWLLDTELDELKHIEL